MEDSVEALSKPVIDTSQIEMLATGEWCPASFKTNIGTQGIANLQVSKIKILKYDAVVYIRENVIMPMGGFAVSSQQRMGMKVKGSLPTGSVQVLEIVAPKRIKQNEHVFNDIIQIVQSADALGRKVIQHHQFTLEWAEQHIKQKHVSSDSDLKKLIKKINSMDWWRTAVSDEAAIKERGLFLASSYKEAEFYGRPIDEPFSVEIENPLIGSEPVVMQKLGLTMPTEDIPVAERFELDKKMKDKAVALGFRNLLRFVVRHAGV